jgi:hypothetical protein
VEAIMSDDDRPRKSWREIDRGKDRSTHRREDRPDPGQRRGARRERSYRAKLDRLFDSGKIGDLVEQKAPGTDAKGEETGIRMLAKIRDAPDRDAVTQAVDAYVAKHGDLPDDLEVLGRAIEHRDVGRQIVAMERIDGLLDEGRKPRRARAMVGQLKMIRDIGDDKEAVDLAKKLIDRL